MPDSNEQIALAVNPDRSGWAWEDCPFQYLHAGLTKPCPGCYGTGRVPISLEKPEYHLYLWGWARSTALYELPEVCDSDIDLRRAFEAGDLTPEQFSASYRHMLGAAMATVLKETS